MSEQAPLLVVDSSVAYKWFNPEGEANVPKALALLWQHARGECLLVAPAHMAAEVLNGLRYSGLEPDAMRRAPEKLASAGILAFPLDQALTESALDLALAYDLTVNDALFPALAVQLDCELVTADRRQARVQECPVRLLA